MNPDEINPYAAPQSNVLRIEAEIISDVPSAGSGKRFLNFLIDRFAVFGIFFVAGIVLVILDNNGTTNDAAAIFDDLGYLQDILLTGAVSLIYYTCFESACGRTLGKLITGTKVVTISGKPLTFGVVLARSLSRLVPFEPFSFLSSADSGWHDTWSGTRVVDLRAKPVPKPRTMSAGNMPRFYQPQVPVQPAAPPSNPS